MKNRLNYMFLNITIIISCVFSVLIHFVIVPLFLSLDLFGLQDATFEGTLQTRYYLEFLFFAAFGLLFICQMIIILFINIKTHRQTLEAKKKTKVISIVFLVSSIIYGIGALVINFIDEDTSNLTCIMALLPIILYLLISIYTFFAYWSKISKKEITK